MDLPARLDALSCHPTCRLILSDLASAAQISRDALHLRHHAHPPTTPKPHSATTPTSTSTLSSSDASASEPPRHSDTLTPGAVQNTVPHAAPQGGLRSSLKGGYYSRCSSPPAAPEVVLCVHSVASGETFVSVSGAADRRVVGGGSAVSCCISAAEVAAEALGCALSLRCSGGADPQYHLPNRMEGPPPPLHFHRRGGVAASVSAVERCGAASSPASPSSSSHSPTARPPRGRIVVQLLATLHNPVGVTGVDAASEAAGTSPIGGVRHALLLPPGPGAPQHLQEVWSGWVSAVSQILDAIPFPHLPGGMRELGCGAFRPHGGGDTAAATTTTLEPHRDTPPPPPPPPPPPQTPFESGEGEAGQIHHSTVTSRPEGASLSQVGRCSLWADCGGGVDLRASVVLPAEVVGWGVGSSSPEPPGHPAAVALPQSVVESPGDLRSCLLECVYAAMGPPQEVGQMPAPPTPAGTSLQHGGREPRSGCYAGIAASIARIYSAGSPEFRGRCDAALNAPLTEALLRQRLQGGGPPVPPVGRGGGGGGTATATASSSTSSAAAMPYPCAGGRGGAGGMRRGRGGGGGSGCTAQGLGAEARLAGSSQGS